MEKRKFTSEQKLAILKQASELGVTATLEKHGIYPATYYNWKTVSGIWLSYSYGDESFFWSDPKKLAVLFSFRKGLLIYSPVLIFSFIGFVFLYQKNKAFFWPVVVVFAIYLYVVSSWWSWWYGGSFGMRALIDVFGLLAIPLGYTINYL